MASNYTENFNLCQWLETDAVLRSDFNADNQKIDTALNNVPRMVSDSYVGNGKFGADNPRTLAFSFTPLLVVITADNSRLLDPGSIFIHGQEKSDGLDNCSSSEYNLGIHLTWGDKCLTWYSDSNASKQLNTDGLTYRYFAIGI